MTSAQADRLIRLLEAQQPKRRVDVAKRAASASGILDVFAALVLVLSGLGLLGAIWTMFTTGFLSGLMTAVIVLAGGALYWASLTVASVIAGYVANKSS